MAQVTNSNLFDINTGIRLEDACIVIVRTEWNAAILDVLETGCTTILKQFKVGKVKVVTVPGAIEIPFAIKAYWDAYMGTAEHPSAFIALGAVIKGDTPHFEYVCNAVTNGISELNLSIPVPTIFGVLTVNTEAQALERIGGVHGHKGEEAAITAIKMIALQQSFK